MLIELILIDIISFRIYYEAFLFFYRKLTFILILYLFILNLININSLL